MDIQIPCIRKMKWNSSGGTEVNFAFGGGEDGSVGVYIMITPEDSPVSIEITPFPPYIIPVPNFDFIFNELFGKSRIQIQKDEIQKYLTQIFRYIFNTYGFPLHDDHALQFKSSGVRREFLARPDLAILADAMWTDADAIITGSFGYDKSGPGIHERFVNQFLANAAYNNWPLQATLDLWHAIVKASTCPKPGTTTPEPPPPEPPPSPPPPPPARDSCPPGWSMDDCLAACGKIRQLTAGQQPLPPELLNVLDYFRDCILPPDGSWQYNAPMWQQSWQVKNIAALPFLPQGDEIRIVPPEYWPYDFPQGTTEVDIISSAAPGSKYPVNTIAILGQPDYQYIITPDGELHCRYDPPTGTPDPPDVDDPAEPEQPDDPTPRLDDLQQQVWALKQSFEQFRETMFTADMALRQAVWQGFTRSNMQAAEVYAKDQPQWSGPPPGAQDPPFPPGWQSYPPPGGTQVLEIPPIQEFPQVLEVQPFDPLPLQEQINQIIDVNSNQWGKLEEIEQRIPLLINEGINAYDLNTEKPDLQRLRDECCQPPAPPPEPEPVDICQEGREQWGIMGECWLQPHVTDPGPIDVDKLWANRDDRIYLGQDGQPLPGVVFTTRTPTLTLPDLPPFWYEQPPLAAP